MVESQENIEMQMMWEGIVANVCQIMFYKAQNNGNVLVYFKDIMDATRELFIANNKNLNDGEVQVNLDLHIRIIYDYLAKCRENNQIFGDYEVENTSIKIMWCSFCDDLKLTTHKNSKCNQCNQSNDCISFEMFKISQKKIANPYFVEMR